MNKSDRPRREAVDGLLLLNKPAGLSSNQALQKVKWLLRAKKAGHTGSLDPAATGMLPLCFGEATKVCPYLLNADKTYRVSARLGTATDTGDADGKEIDRADVPQLSTEQWNEILQSFVGETEQVPPMYSALKKDGKRLYELARKGVTVERESRPIRIDKIDLLEVAGKRLVFRVACSKGTYIRVLVEDIAKAAGTVAHTSHLHREVVGDFETADMLELSALEAAAEDGPEPVRQLLQAPDVALTGYPAVSVSTEAAARFQAGMPVPADSQGFEGLVRVYDGQSRFLGLGEAEKGDSVAPKRVFQTSEKNS